MKYCLIYGALGILSLAVLPLNVAAIVITSLVVFDFLVFFIGALCKEIYFLRKYRIEYIACADAIMSGDEKAVEEVNQWTTHYYVHASFSMKTVNGRLMPYNYSIRDRSKKRLTP